MTTLLICYSMTIVARHYLASFPQATLHRVFGHWPGARFLAGIGRNNSVVALAPALVVQQALQFFMLPLWLFAVCLVGIGVLMAAFAHLHEQFHIAGSWLERFRWFHHKRADHLVHHDVELNFMVADHTWDRALGTFAPARHVGRDAANR